MGFWRTPQCFLKPRSFRFLCLGIWRGSFKPQKPVIEARVPQATLPHCPMRRRLRIVPLHADTSPAPPALSRWPTLWQLRGRPAAGAEASRLLPGTSPASRCPFGQKPMEISIAAFPSPALWPSFLCRRDALLPRNGETALEKALYSQCRTNGGNKVGNCWPYLVRSRPRPPNSRQASTAAWKRCPHRASCLSRM